MKKLFMMALILGTGTITSAGIQIMGPDMMTPSDIAWITVYSDEPLVGGWGGYVAILLPEDMGQGASVEWTGAYQVAPQPVGPTFEVTYYGDFRPDFSWDLWYVDMTNPAVTPTPAGDYIEFEIHWTGMYPAEIIVTNLNGVELDRLQIWPPCEPSGLLLLGVGALLFRPRRRPKKSF